MPRAKLKDGSIEDFQSQYTGQEWREIVADITSKTLTGSATPFDDVKFQGGSGRVFSFRDIVEILPEMIVPPH